MEQKTLIDSDDLLDRTGPCRSITLFLAYEVHIETRCIGDNRDHYCGAIDQHLAERKLDSPT